MNKKRICGGSERTLREKKRLYGKEEENCKENNWMRRIVINK
jgi:hypothetical protein